MCNIIINTFYIRFNDNDVTHRKIFTLSKLLVIFYTLKYGEFITYYFTHFSAVSIVDLEQVNVSRESLFGLKKSPDAVVS